MARIPKYRKQKRANGNHVAFVELAGQRVYLGPHGSAVSRQEYARVLAEFEAAGGHSAVASDIITVSELAARYWSFAETYYRRDGEATGELGWIKLSLRPLVRLYGSVPAKNIGQIELATIQADMIAAGLVRTSINSRIGKLKRMFRWASKSQLVPASVYNDLRAVEGLKAGRSDAIESAPVIPVTPEAVEATIQHVSAPVRAMIELQTATGMRPGEVRGLQGRDLTLAVDPWEYRPRRHKTQHRGHERVIFLGPKSQGILTPFLKGDPTAFVFSPLDVPGCAAKNPFYSKRAYNLAIERACVRAGVEQWSPNQLRHLSGSQIRESSGLESAQAFLGHRNVKTTERYTGTIINKTAQALARKLG